MWGVMRWGWEGWTARGVWGEELLGGGMGGGGDVFKGMGCGGG